MTVHLPIAVAIAEACFPDDDLRLANDVDVGRVVVQLRREPVQDAVIVARVEIVGYTAGLYVAGETVPLRPSSGAALSASSSAAERRPFLIRSGRAMVTPPDVEAEHVEPDRNRCFAGVDVGA
jgi:hypothetical protein